MCTFIFSKEHSYHAHVVQVSEYKITILGAHTHAWSPWRHTATPPPRGGDGANTVNHCLHPPRTPCVPFLGPPVSCVDTLKVSVAYGIISRTAVYVCCRGRNTTGL